jgi:hypothetical protein
VVPCHCPYHLKELTDFALRVGHPGSFLPLHPQLCDQVCVMSNSECVQVVKIAEL